MSRGTECQGISPRRGLGTGRPPRPPRGGHIRLAGRAWKAENRVMRRVLRIAAASLAVLALSAVLALADPELRVSYVDGVPRIEIAGSYPQARYTVWRRPSIDAHAVPIGSENVLCLGSCFVD